MKTRFKHLLAGALVFSGLAALAGEPATVVPEKNSTIGFHPVKKERKILNVRPSAFTSMEEDREPHGPGVFAHLGIFIPSQPYMDPYYIPEWGLFNVGFTAEVGNYFRFFHTDRFGVGLRVTWIQLGYTTHADPEFLDGNAFGSPIRLGPQFSYAINEVMGLDVYYNIGPHYSINWFEGENNSFVGGSHEVGLGYRFSLFTAGFAYKFGRLVNIDNSDPIMPLDTELYSTNMIRVFLGIAL